MLTEELQKSALTGVCKHKNAPAGSVFVLVAERERCDQELVLSPPLQNSSPQEYFKFLARCALRNFGRSVLFPRPVLLNGYPALTFESLPVLAMMNENSALMARVFNHCGEGEIRTLETLTSLPVFETGAFDHSATSPSWRKKRHGAADAMRPSDKRSLTRSPRTFSK